MIQHNHVNDVVYTLNCGCYRIYLTINNKQIWTFDQANSAKVDFLIIWKWKTVGAKGLLNGQSTVFTPKLLQCVCNYTVIHFLPFWNCGSGAMWMPLYQSIRLDCWHLLQYKLCAGSVKLSVSVLSDWYCMCCVISLYNIGRCRHLMV